MKKSFKLNAIRRVAGITIFAAVIVFSMTRCATGGGSSRSTGGEAITVTVTGDFSEYAGRKAWLVVGDDTYAMPLNVSASSASLPFTLLRLDNDKVFTKSGAYMIILWFREGDDKSKDINFVIMSKQINGGENRIEFSSFSEL